MDVSETDHLLERTEFIPRFITEDSRNRRLLYLNDIRRNEEETRFEGAPADFLHTLDLRFSIRKAEEQDLKRAEELTVRTHQLNSTGCVYNCRELKEFIQSEEYEVLIAQLNDKFGEYGKIGLAVLKKSEKNYHLQLLLMSCRVMSGGVGTVFLNWIAELAKENHVNLIADFIATDKNRMMYVTFKLNGFRSAGMDGAIEKLELDPAYSPVFPEWIKLV